MGDVDIGCYRMFLCCLVIRKSTMAILLVEKVPKS